MNRNNEVWPFLFLVGFLLFNWPFLEIFSGSLQFYLFASWGFFILLIGILLAILTKKEPK
jgi:hypothetical protein